MLATGIRVVRGPDWIWDNQDGGEGHVGTVREIGRLGSSNSPEKTVVVNWDSGNRTNYRVGYQDRFDLIVVDNAQIGVKHPNIICDGCSKAGIAGIRFRCAQCNNFDLCAMCYGNDIHDLDHPFIRYQTINSVGVRVPPREGSVKIQLKGIFVGAKVVRGPDWEWGQQDGGEGRTGRVMEIRGWDNESCRSVANVTWMMGSVNVYRLGHQGNADLKYVQPAIGGYYYRDHMPVLGHCEEQQAEPSATPLRPAFSVGDRVKICIELDSLIKLQKGHGGWNPRMEQFITKTGIVHRITDKGDIRVQYENCANRWTIHPAALIKVYVFHVGDIVTIISDLAKVKQLQQGHGEWVEIMRHALGKMGKVTKVYDDGDLRIQEIESGRTWTLNPKCVRLERSSVASAAERSNSMMDLSHQRTDHVMLPLSGLSGSSAADKLVREAAQGKLDYVKHYLSAHPDQVDVMSGGKTCLQVAAHQGHLNMVRYLLSHGASVNKMDKEGDSTLHYAAFGNQPEIMRILLQNGADINVLNGSHCSALHISAHKKPPQCVKVLLEFGADINIQDSYGDTALHDAIGKENTEVVELLCGSETLDLMVRNKRGFNALHHASLKGNSGAAKKILQVARHLVDVKKEDGFAALHLAALNGHAQVVEVLVADGQADINIRNNRRQTPFLLAVSQGHVSVIEKLVGLGCDVLANDEDGDNAINLTIIKKSNLPQEFNHQMAPRIYEIFQMLNYVTSTQERLMYSILSFLIEAGCPIESNLKGVQIFGLCIDDRKMKEFILGFKKMSINDSDQVQNDLTNSEVMYSNVQDDQPTAANITSSTTSNATNSTSTTSNNNNLELTTSAEGNNNNSEATVVNSSSSPPSSEDQAAPPPMTPMRRNRIANNNNNMNAFNTRDTATPSPSLNTDESQTEIVPVPKKPSNSCVSPPPVNRHLIPPPIPPPSTSANHQDLPSNNINNNEATASPCRIAPQPRSAISNKPVNSNILNNNTSSTSGTMSNHSMKISNSVLQSDPKECIVCNEVVNLLLFDPCGHHIACEDCGKRMKKCLTCGVAIEKRFDACGKEITYNKDPKVASGAVFNNNNNNINSLPNVLISNQKDPRIPQQQQQQQQQQLSVDRLRYLESKILEIEETHCCSICMERRRNVAFLCGHGACSKCAETLKTCHMCRKNIVKKINLY